MLQLLGALPIVRAGRGRLGSSVGFWVYVGLFIYHGFTTVLGSLSDAPKLGYTGLQQSSSDLAHVVATANMVAFSVGYSAWSLRRRRPAAQPNQDLSSITWNGVIATGTVALAIITLTLASGQFFTARFELAEERQDYIADVAAYFLAPITMLAAAYLSVRLYRVGRRQLALVGPFACFLVAAATGRRAWIVIIGGTLLMALSSVRVRLLSRRGLYVAAAATVIVSALYVSFRTEVAGRIRTTDDLIDASTQFATRPGDWWKASAVADDFSYRADGHVFLAQVLQGQRVRDPLGLESIPAVLGYMVPSALWPQKGLAELAQIEDLSVRSYGMPGIDYTPTILDEAVAIVGPWWAIVVMTAIGAGIAFLDLRIANLLPPTRLIVFATLVQGIVNVESATLGILSGARTMLILLALAGVSRALRFPRMRRTTADGARPFQRSSFPSSAYSRPAPSLPDRRS